MDTHLAVWASDLARFNAGSSRPANIAMMTITAKSSTNVNAVICRFQLLRVIKSRNQDEASPGESEIQGKQLGLVIQKMNEVCFGNAYLDQPGIPFVLFMGGNKRLPGVFIDAGGFEEMPCSNPD